MNFFKDSRLLMVLSMTIFGTLAPFVRLIPISSAELALWRAVLAMLFIGGVLLITKQKIPFRSLGRELPLLLLSGMAMGINWILLFEAYKYTTVSTATLSYYFAPVLVMLISPLLFRERMTVKQILCFVMSTVGVVLIIDLGNLGVSGTHLIGIFCGLGAACFYATVVLLNKFIRGVAGIPRTLLQFLAAILILVIYVALTGGVSFAQMNGTGWVCLLIVGLFHTGITYCMYFSSLKELPGQKAAILSYIDPLVAIIVSVLVLKESISPMQILGGALILGFTLWNELGNTPKNR